MEVVAFWAVVATLIVMGALNARRGYELKHETIRLMLDKGQPLDEKVFREVLAPPKWVSPRQPTPGTGYTVMRVIGTMALFAALGVALLIFLIGHTLDKQVVETVGVGVGLLIGLLGVGLHVACRFLTPPQRSAAHP